MAVSVVERGPSGPCGDALAPVRCWIRAGPPGEGLVLRGWRAGKAASTESVGDGGTTI